MRRVFLGNVIAHTSRQQRPEHVREGKQQQSTAAESIDCPHSRPSKQEVNESEPERGNQSFFFGRTALLENGRRVEGDDIDWRWSVQFSQVLVCSCLLPHIC